MAIVVVFCTIYSLIMNAITLAGDRAATAAPERTTTGGTGITEDVVRITEGVVRQADPSTMDTYRDVLDFETSTRYAGRLWSDKSVFAYGKGDTGSREGLYSDNTLTLTKDLDGTNGEIKLDADFLHVYSVLGSSLQTGEPIPADLVLALDISGSMNSPIANENENWINTVDPTKADSFSSMAGLGFYAGRHDEKITETTPEEITGIVTSSLGKYKDDDKVEYYANYADSKYTDYAYDHNKIPNAIVPVIPNVVNTNDIPEDNIGQMNANAFKNYNKYLTFCNELVDAFERVYGKYGDDSSEWGEISDTSLNWIRSLVDKYYDYLSTAERNKLKDALTDESCKTLYKVYLEYRSAVDTAFKNGRDPWLSDNTQADGNAMWPYANWEEALNKINWKCPDNPMKNMGNAPNRMYYMIDAANSFIDKFLSLNPTNRISVVVYDSVATVLMPLAHYEKADDANYLSAEKHHWQQWGGTGQWACTVTVNARPTSGYDKDNIFGGNLNDDGVYTASVTSWTNTGTAIALNAGLDILANSYGDVVGRLPVLILMTDGAANIATTGLAANASLPDPDPTTTTTTDAEGNNITITHQNVILDEEWIKGAKSIGKTDSLSVFNSYDNRGNALAGITDDTSNGLTVYGADNGHVYGSESHANTRYGIVLNTLMSTAYKKDQVEKHYNGTNIYPSDKADQDAWTEANIYTIGFGLDYYSSIEGICGDILNPKDNFDRKTLETDNTFIAAYNKMLDDYKNWRNGSSLDIAFNENDPIKRVKTDTTYTDTTLHFQIAADASLNTPEFRDDIDRNIRYNAEYYNAVLTGDGSDNDKTLQGVFDVILSLVQNKMFTPVGGSNDLGVEDSVTYMDPIGKYMEVKDVTNLLLFGTLHGVVKTAVYDYSFNDEFKNGSGDFENGWYSRDKNGNIIKSSTNNISWNNNEGWEYHVNSETAQQFLPNETEIDFTNPSYKVKNTTYTFYRLAEEYEVRNTLRMNPAYKDENGNPTQFDENTPGAYKLSDLRIWVEDTGDYSDDILESSGLSSDTNFDQALYVNLPVSMLPLRTIMLTPTADGGYTYTTNLDEGTAGYSASFPMRVFYKVGVDESILTTDRKIDVTKINAEYMNDNMTSSTAAATARGIDANSLEFFSNWYNPLNRYTAYAVSSKDHTYGAPAVSFSPNADNRYYIFEKSLPVYSEAYQYKDGKWVCLVDPYVDPTNSNSFTPTTFGGKLLAIDLEPTAETSDGITDALNKKGITATEGGIVLLKNALITDSRKVHRHDKDGQVEADTTGTDFTSNHYYYIPLEYYELKNDDNSTKMVQYVVARRGSEFGSAYKAAGLSNGELLCWYDVSGKYDQIYPYLSATETGVQDRGKSYIGYSNILNANGKPKALADLADQKTDAEEIQQNGTWVIAAKVGGLRVGDLAKDVQNKGGDYKEYDPVFVNERYDGYKDLTWHYCEKNTTRTANNYYVPTISAATNTSASGAAAAIVNTYLGNNGRLWVPITSLLLTKTVEVEGEKPDSVDKTEFDYQVYIQNFTGARNAIVVRYNAESKSWQRQLHYIDMDLDSKLFLQTKDGQKAMVDADGKPVTGNAESGYVYVDGGEEYKDTVYYVYIGKNTTGEATSETAMRVYHNSLVEDHGYSVGVNDITVEYDDEYTGTAGDADNNYFGVRTFYAAKVGLVPVNQYESFNSSTTDPILLPNFKLLTLVPSKSSEDMVINSPYRTSSAYWTKTLNFGIGCDDLYDKTNPFGEDKVTLSQIADNTAKTTLKNGYGLLFSGMDEEASYRFTEKLSDDDIDCGYSFDRVVHNSESYKLNDTFAEGSPVNFQMADHVYSVFGTIGPAEPSGHYFNRTNTVENPRGLPSKTETKIESSDKAETLVTKGVNLKDGNDGKLHGPLVNVGNMITYEVTWENYTNEAATVTVRDPLDSNVKFLSASFDPKDTKPLEGAMPAKADIDSDKTSDGTVTVDGDEKTVLSYNEAEHQIVWNLGEQPAGAKGKVTLVVKVLDSATPIGYVDNTAWVQVGNEAELKTETIENPICDYLLPNTGGSGTEAYVIFGVLIMSASASMLWLRKRRNPC